MIDFHCHLLPRVDDGPQDMDESVEMAAALSKAGFRAVYCTPHLMKGIYETNNGVCTAYKEILQQRLKTEKIDLRLRLGREYYLDEFIFEHLRYPLPLEGTNFILLEIPGNIPVDFVKQACFQIKKSGFTPMIAHPERSSGFSNPEKNARGGISFYNTGSDSKTSDLLDYLLELGCAFQGNYGSFLGIYGSHTKKTADLFKQQGLYTHFGTDLHSRDAIKYLEEDWKIEA